MQNVYLKLSAFTIVFLLLYSTAAHGQRFKFKEGVQLDTLFVSLSFSPEIDPSMRNKLDSVFDLNVNLFNKSQSALLLVKDSTAQSDYLRIAMEPIYYVTSGRSMLLTAIDLVLIGGHVASLASTGWILPVYPFLLPSTTGKTIYHFDPLLVKGKPDKKNWTSTTGYFMSEQRQKKRFLRKFDRDLRKSFTYINMARKESR